MAYNEATPLPQVPHPLMDEFLRNQSLRDEHAALYKEYTQSLRTANGRLQGEIDMLREGLRKHHQRLEQQPDVTALLNREVGPMVAPAERDQYPVATEVTTAAYR